MFQLAGAVRFDKIVKLAGFKSWRIKGAALGTPLSVQFLSFSYSFGQKSCQEFDFCPKHRGWHLHLGNPGSTNVNQQPMVARGSFVLFLLDVFVPVVCPTFLTNFVSFTQCDVQQADSLSCTLTHIISLFGKREIHINTVGVQ